MSCSEGSQNSGRPLLLFASLLRVLDEGHRGAARGRDARREVWEGPQHRSPCPRVLGGRHSPRGDAITSPEAPQPRLPRLYGGFPAWAWPAMNRLRPLSPLRRTGVRASSPSADQSPSRSPARVASVERKRHAVFCHYGGSRGFRGPRARNRDEDQIQLSCHKSQCQFPSPRFVRKRWRPIPAGSHLDSCCAFPR